MALPGPPELGRGVVVSPEMRAPEPWSRCPRLSIRPETLDDPGTAVTRLQQAWFSREPVVVELAITAQELQERETNPGPVHDLDPRFEFSRERLHFLVWANSYDARSGDPIWWHGRKAARRFAGLGVAEGGPADIELADGTALYVDGGPFAPPPLPDGVGVVHRWNTEVGSLSVVGHSPPAADLAPDQLAAVRHATGGARVIAPAGSGKTRVLTERLCHLITDRGADPSTVTALAYNRKAADELVERTSSVVTAGRPHIRTLNSMGQWICDTYGGQGRLRVLEEPSVRDLVQQVFEVRRQANTDTVLPYIDALSSVRLGLSAPARVEELIPDAQGLAERFDTYRSTLAEAAAVDFDEQIYRAIEILLADPDARSAAQGRCRHLLVDEFQDLNAAHMLLIRLLSAPAFGCFGVGDDDQVIYGYAGATPEYLINFGDFFPGAHSYALEVNYRCPPAVVRAATSILSYNVQRIAKRIRTPEDRSDELADFDPLLAGRGPVAVLRARSDELPKTALTAISSWMRGGVALGEIAVLTRVNSTLLPVQIALAEAGIPSNAPLDRKALERTGVRTALAYLRMGLDPGALSATTSSRRSGDHRAGSPPTWRPWSRSARRPRSRRSGAWPVASPGETSPSSWPMPMRSTRWPRPARTRRRQSCGPSACRSAWARRWTSWTRRDGRPIDRPTPTTSSPSRRWRRCTPRRRRSRRGCASCWPGAPPADQQCCSRRSTRSRAGNGNTSSSTALRKDSCPTA